MAGPNPDKVQQVPVRDRPAVRAFRTLWRGYAHVSELHKKRVMAITGLTVSEFDMVAALGNTDGLRMGELALQMITSPANVTRVAVAMQKKGLVERRRSEHSDREVVAFLTEAGERHFDEHFEHVVSVTMDLFSSALSDRELATFAKLCTKLLDAE